MTQEKLVVVDIGWWTRVLLLLTREPLSDTLERTFGFRLWRTQIWIHTSVALSVESLPEWQAQVASSLACDSHVWCDA